MNPALLCVVLDGQLQKQCRLILDGAGPAATVKTSDQQVLPAQNENETVLEKQIERYLVDRVKALGGVAYKFTSPAHRGVADRVVCLPDGQTWFVEVKTEGGRLSPLQKVFMSDMARMKQNYVCLWNKEQINEWLNEVA